MQNTTVKAYRLYRDSMYMLRTFHPMFHCICM